MLIPAFAFQSVRPNTPARPLSDAVLLHCKRLSTATSVLMPFRFTDERYRAAYCHLNVMHAVRTGGGERVFGWLVWELPGRLVDAEFHVVWRTPGGELVDLTPRADGEPEVLFVPDRFAVSADATFSGPIAPTIRSCMCGGDHGGCSSSS